MSPAHQTALRRYDEICAHFHPVFHHFLLEHFPEPAVWFERRLAYTRSVAVNSMVGYVLGIGDRHTQNILVDKTTAEFVHIDFGVIFGQGRFLKIPELVPFRLTRDVVDAMGILGVEGKCVQCLDLLLPFTFFSHSLFWFRFIVFRCLSSLL